MGRKSAVFDFIRQGEGKQDNPIIWIALISALLLVLVAGRSPQGINVDSALQMKSLQQYLAGESPSINHLVRPKLDNLMEDTKIWATDAPPSTQLFTYPLIKNGVGLGDALRIVVIISLLIGTAGWIYWFLLFSLPRWIIVTLAFFVPWMRYPSNYLFYYSADILCFAATPWILLAAYSLGKVCDRSRYGFLRTSLIFSAFGFCLGLAYLLKYSLIFVSLGAMVYLGIKIFRKSNSGLLPGAISFATLAVSFIIPIAALGLLNYKLGGQLHLSLQAPGLNFRWQNLLCLLANPVLAVASAGEFFRYILFHPEHGLVKNEVWLGIVGLPGGLLLWWLILRGKALKDYALEAIITLVVSSIALLGLWSLHYGIGYQARHITSAGIAILPLLIQNAIYLLNITRRSLVRIVLLGAGIIYIAVPLLFGVSSVAAKVVRRAGYRVGPSHIYNPNLSNIDIKGVVDKLTEDFSPTRDIWYVVWPATALDLPGRIIMGIAGVKSKDLELIRQERHFSASPLRVIALLPKGLEKDGRAEAIRSSFVQADDWARKEINSCGYVVWTTKLRVNDSE